MKKISSKEIRKHWRDALDSVITGTPLTIERYGKPVAVLFSFEQYQQIQAQLGAVAPATTSIKEPTPTYTTEAEAESDRAALKQSLKEELLVELKKVIIPEVEAQMWHRLMQQLPDNESTLSEIKSYPIWSPIDSFSAANTLLDLLDESPVDE